MRIRWIGWDNIKGGRNWDHVGTCGSGNEGSPRRGRPKPERARDKPSRTQCISVLHLACVAPHVRRATFLLVFVLWCWKDGPLPSQTPPFPPVLTIVRQRVHLRTPDPSPAAGGASAPLSPPLPCVSLSPPHVVHLPGKGASAPGRVQSVSHTKGRAQYRLCVAPPPLVCRREGVAMAVGCVDGRAWIWKGRDRNTNGRAEVWDGRKDAAVGSKEEETRSNTKTSFERSSG